MDCLNSFGIFIILLFYYFENEEKKKTQRAASTVALQCFISRIFVMVWFGLDSAQLMCLGLLKLKLMIGLCFYCLCVYVQQHDFSMRCSEIVRHAGIECERVFFCLCVCVCVWPCSNMLFALEIHAWFW